MKDRLIKGATYLIRERTWTAPIDQVMPGRTIVRTILDLAPTPGGDWPLDGLPEVLCPWGANLILVRDPNDRRILGLPVDRIDRAEPVNAPKGELTMDYIDWVTEHSPLAMPDKAVIAEPPKSRLFSRTFHEAELVSLAKLATWLGVGSRPLLEAAQERATIQGAVPPTPFVSGSPPQFYFWLSEVHQAWPMNGHTPVSERRP